MLRNTLLLFFHALIISASAQHTRITLDASTMRMTTPKSCLSMDSTTVIELINVNPATQKVTITGKNVRVYTEPSGKVGDFIGFPASNTAEAKADVNAAVGQKPTTKETEQQQSETRTLLEEMKEQNNKLLADQKKLKEELNKIVSRPVTTDIEAIKNLLADYAKGSKEESLSAENVRDYKPTLDSINVVLKQQLEASTKQAERLSKQLEETTKQLDKMNADKYQESIEKLIAKANGVVEQDDNLNYAILQFKVMETILHDACLSTTAIQEKVRKLGEDNGWNGGLHGMEYYLKKAIDEFNEQYDSFLRRPEVSQKMEEDPNEKARVEKIRKAITQIHDAYVKADHPSRMSDVLATYLAVTSGEAFTVRSLPVQAEADLIEFEVKVEPREGHKGPCSPMDGVFTYKQYICGGAKVDFGTGPVAIIGLVDRSYRLDTDPNDDAMRILRQNTELGNVRPALAATVHISKRTNRKWKPDGLIGFGLNMTEFSDVTMYGGAGILLGRDPWASIHVGAVLSQVDALKPSLQVDRSYDADELKENDLTAKRYGTGFFFGISFLWPKTEKQTKPVP
ncbi:MAG TPA: hypothetical protein PLE78_14300 [Flavobacteriales bacterium]|mgnify:CR=1 FL=1|jgi:hypothetical protein|nr:hypothetical protein [Flavobacteriales bacterium]HQW42361.1 hypothetical protein [Flavobacteriales bacterium]